MAKVEKALKDKKKYLKTFIDAISALRPTSDPTVFSKDLYTAKQVNGHQLFCPAWLKVPQFNKPLFALQELETQCNPIISRPKPAPPPPAAPPAASGEDGKQVDGAVPADAKPTKGGTKTTTTVNGEEASAAGGEEMDVD